MLRCSAFEIAASPPARAAPHPALGVALLGAPQIPRGGGWSMGVRSYTAPGAGGAAERLPGAAGAEQRPHQPVAHRGRRRPRCRSQQPASYYSLLHATGTNKALFEAPQIPAAAAAAPGRCRACSSRSCRPRCRAASRTRARRTSATWPRSSTRPACSPTDLRALALDLERAAADRHDPAGFSTPRSYTFPADARQPEHDDARRSRRHQIALRLRGHDAVAADAGASSTTRSTRSASPSWTLSLETLSLPGHGPGVRLRPAADHHRRVLRRREHQAGADQPQRRRSAARCRPSRACSATCRRWPPSFRAASAPTWTSRSRTASSPSATLSRIADLPLGLGNLTDISLDLGLHVTLSPLSVDFLVGLGAPDNPFNWIVSPLAGNGADRTSASRAARPTSDPGGHRPRSRDRPRHRVGFGVDHDRRRARRQRLSITVIAILNGQASVDVLDGLAERVAHADGRHRRSLIAAAGAGADDHADRDGDPRRGRSPCSPRARSASTSRSAGSSASAGTAPGSSRSRSTPRSSRSTSEEAHDGLDDLELSLMAFPQRWVGRRRRHAGGQPAGAAGRRPDSAARQRPEVRRHGGATWSPTCRGRARCRAERTAATLTEPASC